MQIVEPGFQPGSVLIRWGEALTSRLDGST